MLGRSYAIAPCQNLEQQDTDWGVSLGILVYTPLQAPAPSSLLVATIVVSEVDMPKPFKVRLTLSDFVLANSAQARSVGRVISHFGSTYPTGLTKSISSAIQTYTICQSILQISLD